MSPRSLWWRPLFLVPVALALLAGFAAAAVGCGGETGPSEEGHGPEAERIMEHIRVLSQEIGARPVGSASEAEAVDYGVTQFESYGYNVQIQPVTTYLRDGTDVEKATSSNVIALPASEQCETLSGAHYDSVADSPGANDNASGVAVVLELAREMTGRGDHCFVLFGAEETGLDGSQTFVTYLTFPLSQAPRPRAMLNFDYVGGPGSMLLVGSSELAEQAANIADEAGIQGEPGDVRPGFRSDHLAFLNAGIPTLWFTTPPFDYVDSPEDTVEHVEPAVLEDVYRVALLLLQTFDGD